jgi:hypothetical protein
MTVRSAGSLVFALAMVLQGNGGLIAGRAPVPLPVEAPKVKEGFQVWNGRSGVVIDAPHGTSDRDTDLIGGDLARVTGFGLVVEAGLSHLASRE